MSSGGLYPTSGFQIGLGVIICDYTKPDNLIRPRWFIQISTVLDTNSAYFSFTIGSIPITELLQAPCLIWETLKELSSPGQAFKAVREFQYFVYSFITFKVEWPLLPLNPLLSEPRGIYQFLVTIFGTKNQRQMKTARLIMVIRLKVNLKIKDLKILIISKSRGLWREVLLF